MIGGVEKEAIKDRKRGRERGEGSKEEKKGIKEENWGAQRK